MHWESCPVTMTRKPALIISRTSWHSICSSIAMRGILVNLLAVCALAEALRLPSAFIGSSLKLPCKAALKLRGAANCRQGGAHNSLQNHW